MSTDSSQASAYRPTVRRLGLREYTRVWQDMRHFTTTRTAHTPDEIWLVEHPSVYTLGQAGRREHLLAPADIPIVESDRGGQVTYHGPGQLIAYVLVDLRRRGLGVKQLVTLLEQAVVDLLEGYSIVGERKGGAPGVYVHGAKIAALGLRVKRGCSYHGVSLNVDMDLAPFEGINPCGYSGLQVTQLRDLIDACNTHAVAELLLTKLTARLLQATDALPPSEPNSPAGSA